MIDLFIYGTLLPGQAQGGLLAGLGSERAAVRGLLYAMPGGYPALVPTAGARPIQGALVRGVDARLVALLDRYEGVAEGLYTRELVDVVVGLRTLPAQTYVGCDPVARGGRLVDSDRWRAVLRRGR